MVYTYLWPLYFRFFNTVDSVKLSGFEPLTSGDGTSSHGPLYHCTTVPKLLSLSFLVVLSMFTWLHKHKNNKNCCGGQGVSVLAFYSDDLSSNPAEIYSFYPVNYLIRTRWKLPRCGQIYKCSKIASIAPKSNLRSDKTNSRFVNYDRLGVIGFQKPAQMAIAFGVRCGM